MSLEFKCTICGKLVELDVSEEALKEFIKTKTSKDMEQLKPICGECMNRVMVGPRHLSKN